MARIPLLIEKIQSESYRLSGENSKKTEYIITIEEKNEKWHRVFRCNYEELESLRTTISNLLDSTTTAEKLGIDENKASTLDDHYKKDNLCQSCRYKQSQDCIECIFVLQSPLERLLFLALKENHIKFQTQYPFNWKGEKISIEGKAYNNPLNNFKEVLTVVDFYIERGSSKLCVYTDGHTYHERTEEQAQRDKRIDRKLQQLGYQVLRYTGKDVKENVTRIIDEIKDWLDKGYDSHK